MNSRQGFAKEVALTISKNHCSDDSDESFIFGISGKWGEGKTRFLKDLEKELKSQNFKVIWVNPWKFAYDKVAFLRRFILFLSNEVKWPWFFKRKHKIDELSYDVSQAKVSAYSMFAIGVFIGGLLFLGLTLLSYWPSIKELLIWYYSPSKTFLELLTKWKYFIGVLSTAIISPLLINAIQSSLKTDVSRPSIATLDKFDELLNAILSSVDSKKKLVIFVDDLDRLSPQAAREVLDALRTFFDKKNLTFVVTADHTVLERHLGNELLPNGTSQDKLEEGRRFLKKIFNYNWRLLLPIDKEFDSILDAELKKKADELNVIFDAGSQLILKQWLIRYFGKNLRETFRFLEMVIFTFRIVDIQLNASEPNNRVYYEELKSHPLLVTRVLMIQERCAPLFEKIIYDDELFFKLERFASRGATAELSELIDGFKFLTEEQLSFLRRFLNETPSFFDTTKPYNLKVHNYRPFLHLAADSSFGDARGPTGYEDFNELLLSGDSEGAKRTLEASGPLIIDKCAKGAFETLNDESLEPEKALNATLTLMKALVGLDASHSAHNAFYESFGPFTFSRLFLEGESEAVSNELIRTTWAWLDHIESTVDRKYWPDYDEQYEALDDESIDAVMEGSKGMLGEYSSMQILSGALKHLEEHPALFAQRFNQYKDRLAIPIVKANLEPHAEKAISLILEDAFSDEERVKSKLFDIFKVAVPTFTGELKTKLIQALKDDYDSSLFNWAYETTGDETWSVDELESIVFDDLKNATTGDRLVNFLSFWKEVDNFTEPAYEKAWKYMLNQPGLLMSVLQETFSENTSHQAIAPNEKESKLLFSLILKAAKTAQAKDEKLKLLRLLMKPNWPWTNFSSINGTQLKSLRSIYKVGDTDVQSVINSVIRSFGQTLPTT